MSDINALRELLQRVVDESDTQTKVKKYKTVDVRRTPEPAIFLPEGMTYEAGIDWLEKLSRDRQEMVEFVHAIDAYPTDGAYAMKEVMEEIYGYVQVKGTAGGFFMPSEPPKFIEIPTGYREKGIIPWGRIVLPSIKGHIVAGFDVARGGLPRFIISAEVSRDAEPVIKNLAEQVEKRVREHSIYRGAPLKADFSWIGHQRFSPDAHRPEFLNLDGIDWNNLILNKRVRAAMNNVVNRIQNPSFCERNGIPIKTGALLAGEYGTGKTLIALNLAKICQDNGWTFLYLPNSEDFAHGLNFLLPYLPAVIFVEDIDKRVADEQREGGMNELINLLDGFETKSIPLITVFTTNHPERIQPVALRAGRIDHFVKMELPDHDSVLQFIQLYAKDNNKNSLLAVGGNYKKAAEIMTGWPPAFISTAVINAKTQAAGRLSDKERLVLTPSDLEAAASAMVPHFELMSQKPLIQRNAFQELKTELADEVILQLENKGIL